MSGVPQGSNQEHEEAVRIGRVPVHLRVKGMPACGTGGRHRSRIMSTVTALARVTCKACLNSRTAKRMREEQAREPQQ